MSYSHLHLPGIVVNNESSEIMKMFFECFDHLLPPEKREINKGMTAFVPNHLRSEVETMNAFVYDNINNGVYKVVCWTPNTWPLVIDTPCVAY